MYIFNLLMMKCIGIAFWGKIFWRSCLGSRFFRCWSRLGVVFMPGAGAGAAGRSRSRREPVGAGAGSRSRQNRAAPQH